jgi:secreted PhoX family phosphatase
MERRVPIDLPASTLFKDGRWVYRLKSNRRVMFGYPGFQSVGRGGVRKFGFVSVSHITKSLSLLAASVMLMTASAAYGGSAALWVVNRQGNFVAEFTGKSLKTGGVSVPSRKLASSDLNEPWGLIFDSKKNLWVSNVGGGTLTKFTFGQLQALKSNDAPAATVVISGLERPEGLAFDKKGNLWVANEGNGELREFTASQLGSSGSPTPAITIDSADVSSPVGLAFDRSGNLWFGDDDFNHVAMFTKAQLAAGGTPSATVILSDSNVSLDSCEQVIFDKSGDLWVADNNNSSVVEFTPGQLALSGAPTPVVTLTPVIVSSTSANSIDEPAGLTFDKSGNLWVGNISSDQFGSVAKFSESSLDSSGSPQPSVFIGSNSLGTNLKQPYFLVFGPKVP